MAVRLDREGGSVLLTIDRPEAKNALDLETIEALSEIVDGLAHDHSLRGVVVTGARGTFISGGDLKDFLSLDDSEAGKRMARRMQSVLARLEALEVPVIAAIEGVALGGGAEVALACDIRIASESSRIAFKQVSLGIMVGWGGGQRLLRLVGRSRALRLLLTGAALTGEEALRIGLVDDVVPAGEALPAALSLARQTAAQPAAAVRATKRALHYSAEMSRAEAAAFEAECFATLWGSADHREAVAALMEKRTPVFRGE
ncbi:MAG: enoyl-CoA hydratase/isomerase family protein [Candidatus Rokubacteria bacterium]|nr:enoyl-CoA hydratase/isomerase family protein [Candidatus Rokubacteria bacterium]